MLCAFPKQKHTANNGIKVKTPIQTLIKWLLSGCRLWFWVLIRCCCISFIHFPHFLMLSPSIMQLSVYFSPRFTLITPFQPNLPVKMCVCQCIRLRVCCARKHIYLVNGQRKVCLFYKLLLRDKEMTVTVNECVYPSIFSRACTDIFCFSVDQLLSLSKYLLPSRSVSWSNLQPEGLFSGKNQKSGILGRVMVGGSKPRWLEPSIEGQQEGSHPGNYQRNVLVTNTSKWKRQRDF